MTRDASGIRIRPGKKEDARYLAALYQDFFRLLSGGDTPFSADVLRRDVFGPRPHFHTLVAEAPDGALVGLAFWHESYDCDHAVPGGYLMDLYVAPEYRKSGVGRRLMAHTARAVAANGGEFLFWATTRDNRRARQFYESIGTWDRDIMIYVASRERFQNLMAQAEE